jgi:hypothetical protein
MKTISLRFGEHFSPACGTIVSHQQMIDERGYVWYGKMGNPVATRIVEELLTLDDTKILLINSGKADRYWAHVSDIKKETPEKAGIPSYYRDNTEKFKTWFKVTSFEPAPKDIMSKCHVVSSGAALGEVSKHSMSPYFIIKYEEKVGE